MLSISTGAFGSFNAKPAAATLLHALSDWITAKNALT